MAWLISRLPMEQEKDKQTVPSWSGYQSLCIEMSPESEIGYLPIIEKSPTTYDTVFTVLQTAQQIAQELQQDKVIITFDQAIYCKALDLVWKHAEIFDNIFLRLGPFHMKMNFMSIIGKRYGSAGLRDLFIESDILAEGSVDAVLSAKHYNRGLRVFKLALEIFFRLHWDGFKKWLVEEKKTSVDDILTLAASVKANCTKDTICLLQGSHDLVKMQSSYAVFGLRLISSFDQSLWSAHCGVPPSLSGI